MDTLEMQASIFAAEVREFRTFMDGCGPFSPDQAGAYLSALLHLYSAALQIPDADPVDHCTMDDPWIQLPAAFGKYDQYWEVFDPTIEDDVVCGSLADDFTDIYQDVSRGLRISEVCGLTAALWQWRFDFRSHWGFHAMDVMRALHHIMVD